MASRLSIEHIDQRLLAALHNPEAIRKELARRNLADFSKQAWHVVEPSTNLVWSWYHDTVCGYLEALHQRKIKRLIIEIPPGTMKSLLVSVFFPAWIWIDDPGHRFLAVANGDTLAVRDNQRMKWLVESDWYQGRWKVEIRSDQAGKGLFGNTGGGLRQAIGVTGNVTGLRGDTQLWDDLLDAMKAFSEAERATVIDAIDQKLSSRLNDPADGGIVLIQQRLHELDPAGHLAKSKTDKWTRLSIPMEYEGPTFDAGADIGRPELNDPRTKIGELLDPIRYPAEAVASLKERLGEYGTAAQLQQRPSPQGGGIIKKKWWTLWPSGKPLPTCKQVFSSYDTAFTEKDYKTAAYTARTTWGIFEDEETGRDALLLMEAWFDRVAYPDLRRLAKSHYYEFNPDLLLIERKASGLSLMQDFRRIKLPCRGFDPKPYGDKIARAHLASPFFQSGLVFYPDREWARKIVDIVASFPAGAPPSADVTDTVTQAVIYVRKRMWMNPPDEDDEPKEGHNTTEEGQEDAPKRKSAAYG